MLTLPAASFAEEKVWFCQEVASGGLKWKDGKYVDVRFRLDRYTIKQKGGELAFPGEMLMGLSTCEYLKYWPNTITCGVGAVQFIINTNTGKATYAQGSGWVIDDPKLSGHDSLYVSALTCETF